MNDLKRLTAVILIISMLMFCGCSDSSEDTNINAASPTTPTANLWDSEQLREFGLKTLKCPSGVIAEKWDYNEATHSLVVLLTSVDDYEGFAKDLFEIAKKSSGGVMANAEGTAISSFSESCASIDLGMYLFYYRTNGTKFYASTIYYDEGSDLLGYPEKSVLLCLKDVAYIKY